MAGNKIGGLKAKKSNLERHGKDFYSEIGRMGGRASGTGGFYANHDLAIKAGAKGGKRSRRGYKLIGETEEELIYINNATGNKIHVKKED